MQVHEWVDVNAEDRLATGALIPLAEKIAPESGAVVGELFDTAQRLDTTILLSGSPSNLTPRLGEAGLGKRVARSNTID